MQPIWRILNHPVKCLLLWAALIIGLITISCLKFGTQPSALIQERITTDLIGLLPATEQNAGKVEASNRLARTFSNRVLFLVSSPSKAEARSSAAALDRKLRQSNDFEELLTHVDVDNWQAIFRFYYPYRYGLLSFREQSLRPDQLSETLINRTLNQLSSPAGITNSRQLIEDPLFQAPTWFESLSSGAGNLRQDEGLLVTEQEGKYYVMISGLLHGDVMSLRNQDNVVNAIEKAIIDITSKATDVQILSSGLIFHGKAGADSARKEVNTIGLGSIIGIIILILIAFRSVSPLFFCLFSIGIGIVSGYLVTLIVFGQVHVMTLVFGASLTGISIDYAFHYMAEWLRQGKHWSPVTGLNHIMPGITLGLITSLLGYIPMVATPFPGLQQMAVFSSAGLLAAWLTVVLVYPVFFNRAAITPENPNHWLLPFVDGLLEVWGKHIYVQRKIILISFVLLLSSSLLLLQSDDDIRQLQTRSPDLVKAEAQIKHVIGIDVDNRFFLVQGQSAEEMLQRSEQLTGLLTEQVQKNLLQGFQSVSNLLPSQAIQQQNYQAISQVFQNQLPELWSRIGLSKEAQQQAISAFSEAKDKVITPSNWLNNPASSLYKHLWLGDINGNFYSAVTLQGVSQQWHPDSVNTPSGVTFIDKTGKTSELFGRYRTLMGWLLLIAYSVITAILALRYGIQGAIKVIIPPAMSVIITLSLYALTGTVINLFHVLALIMVLGIGIDYTLFFYEAGNGQDERRYTFIAITLSALTTLLSFGLLALSSTDAIQSFGLTILTGITLCYLLSPFSIRDLA